MDASLLTDPNFWTDPRPLAPGGFDGEIPDLGQLDHHVLFQTSGSSGRPKWIALSKQALLLSAACVNRHLRVDEDSRWGLALPLHHVGGFGVAVRAFEAACECVTFPGKWDPAAFRAWSEKNAITHTSLVPTQVHDLVTAKLSAPSSITAIVVGGGRLDAITGQAARDLGWPVLASYGMTEACSQIATQSPDLLQTPYQIGNIPLLDIWNARTTPEDLLEISGPSLFSGMLIHDGERWNYEVRSSDWHRTSDRVVLTHREITPLGRADSIVKVLGELVDPEQIERELIGISAGQLIPGSFAITAVPDERAGHRLVPVFEISSDLNLVLNVLSEYQTQAIGYRRLSPPLFMEVLPRSALGKLLRKEIANIAR
jgi:O-succinylbenzoic acid--CoA ligase